MPFKERVDAAKTRLAANPDPQQAALVLQEFARKKAAREALGNQMPEPLKVASVQRAIHNLVSSRLQDRDWATKARGLLRMLTPTQQNAVMFALASGKDGPAICAANLLPQPRLLALQELYQGLADRRTESRLPPLPRNRMLLGLLAWRDLQTPEVQTLLDGQLSKDKRVRALRESLLHMAVSRVSGMGANESGSLDWLNGMEMDRCASLLKMDSKAVSPAQFDHLLEELITRTRPLTVQIAHAGGLTFSQMLALDFGRVRTELYKLEREERSPFLLFTAATSPVPSPLAKSELDRRMRALRQAVVDIACGKAVASQALQAFAGSRLEKLVREAASKSNPQWMSQPHSAKEGEAFLDFLKDGLADSPDKLAVGDLHMHQVLMQSSAISQGMAKAAALLDGDDLVEDSEEVEQEARLAPPTASGPAEETAYELDRREHIAQLKQTINYLVAGQPELCPVISRPTPISDLILKSATLTGVDRTNQAGEGAIKGFLARIRLRIVDELTNDNHDEAQQSLLRELAQGIAPTLAAYGSALPAELLSG